MSDNEHDENSENENENNVSQKNLSTIFKSVKDELEITMETEEDQKQKISSILNSINIPYMNKTCPNYIFNILEMLRKKKKLDDFLKNLSVKKNNHKLLNVMKESFLQELNVLSGIKGEVSSLSMLKFIVGNFLYQLKEKDYKKLEHFISEKYKIEPNYLEKILKMSEKNTNIFTIYLCGLALNVKNSEFYSKLEQNFVKFLVDKIFDDEERDNNVAKLRILSKFINNLSEKNFYDEIISNCTRLFNRSSKNYDFLVTIFINVTKFKYTDQFITETLFGEFKKFFFPENNLSSERDSKIYQSFEKIATNSNINLLLEQILKQNFEIQNLYLYSMNFISFIFKIYSVNQTINKNYKLSDKLILESIIYICENFDKIYQDSPEYRLFINNLFQTFLSALYTIPKIQIDQNEQKDNIEKLITLVDDLITNNSYANYHKYFYLIPAITIEQFSIKYENNNKMCDLFYSLLDDNYNVEITEKNIGNMLPLTTCSLSLSVCNEDFKEKCQEKLNKVFCNLLTSDIFMKNNKLTQIDSICLYLICQFLAKGQSTIMDDETNKNNFLKLLCVSLFKENISHNEIYVFKNLVNILIENMDVSLQLMNLVFNYLLNLDTKNTKISFKLVSIFLDKFCEKYFVNEYINNLDKNMFLKLLILIHVPNMYLDMNINNRRSHHKNMFIDKFYKGENTKNLMISSIEKYINENICNFLFSTSGLFNENNIIIVNACYALINNIFQYTKVSNVLLEQSFGLLTKENFKMANDKLVDYEKKVDYFGKYELIDLVNRIKKNANKYITDFDIHKFIDDSNKENENKEEEKKEENDDLKEDEDEAEDYKKNKNKKNKKNKKDNKKENKKENKSKKKEEIKINEQEYKSYVISFCYKVCNHLLFMLKRLKPIFKLLNNYNLYNTKENIKYTINKTWELLNIGFFSSFIKRCYLEYFKGNDLSKRFSLEFSELMYLESINDEKLFSENYNENQLLISKLNKNLIKIFNDKESEDGKKYMNSLFNYYDFVIIRILFYIILNKSVLMDDIIESVENLINILKNLNSLNYEDISVLLVPLLKSNYYGENLKVLLELYFKNASEKSIIELFKELLNYEYISKYSFLNAVIKQNMTCIKKYQFIHYKIYILSYDENEILNTLAKEIWDKFELQLDEKFMENDDFKLATQEHKATDIVNRAIRNYVVKYPNLFDKILQHFLNFYEKEIDDILAQKEKLEDEEENKEEEEEEEEEEDKKKKNKVNDPQIRKYLFMFINETLNLMNSSKKKDLLDFFMKISDKEYSEEMFNEMNKSIFNIINSIPENEIITKTLTSIKQEIIEIKEKSEDDINYSNLKIIMMMLNSVLVRIFHDKTFTKERETIFDELVNLSNKINNKDVFVLLSKNIEYLSADIPEKSQQKFDEILEKLSKTKKKLYNFGEIYCLSGFIKCFGIHSYKQKKIDEIILKNMEKKSSIEDKQNSMYMIKIFFETMGKLYEPYFVEIFEQISQMITNREKKVRETAQECFKNMMKELSCYGVDKIMPNLIKDLDTMNSKGKIANIEILGQFAYCAPKQLSIYIPKIIKEIMKVLKDPQINVQETAVNVLEDIASTIKNPEIVDNADILIKAIQNPFESSKNALEMLMETEFYHYLDPPSLALIIPILDYNLKSQNDECKRTSAHVLGSIQVLIQDQNDLIQYMDIIVPDLKLALFDNNPECRNEISKAIGALTKSLGVKYVIEMMKYLENYLEKEVDMVQRSGAAQGYAEIIVSFGPQHIDKQLMRLINKIQEGDHIVKEGYLTVFVFLPGCLGDKFEKYFELIFPLIIEAFSDEHESVRNVSNKIFEICIKIFARRNTTELIEPLLERFFAENWRIRNSSIALIKTLITNLGKEFSKEKSEYFSKELRDQILTYSFILKSDYSGNTSTIANIIWRDYVDNIPKYLSKILIPIYNQIMNLLNDEMNEETYNIAQESVRQLATKFSDKFFNELLPIIKENVIKEKDNEYITDASFMMISVAVSEISERLLSNNRNAILKIIYENIFSDFSSVRKKLAQIVYQMSVKLNDHNMNRNLVTNVMKQVRGKSPNIQKKSLEIVGELTEISSGEVIRFVINEIFRKPYEEGFLDLGTMISSEIVESVDDENEAKSLFNSLYDVFMEIPGISMDTIVAISSKLDEDYLPLFIQFLDKISKRIESDNRNSTIEKKKDDKEKIEYHFSELISNFCANTEQSLESIYDNIVEIICNLLYYDNEFVIKNVGGILKSLVEKTNKTSDVDNIIKTLIESLEILYKKIKDDIEDDNENEDKFNEKIGKKLSLIMEHLLFTVQNGLLYGEDKILTCKLISDIIHYCPRKNLKPYIMKLIGPIIRVSNEKISSQTKEKLMENAKNLILKVKEDIKAVSPQLQSVFLKTLTDCSNKTKYERHQIKAGENIILLLKYYPRLDVTANDLLKSVQNKIDQKLGINALFEMEILSDVIRFFGQNLKPDTITKHFNTINMWLDTHPELPYEALVVLLSSYSRFVSKDIIKDVEFSDHNVEDMFKIISTFNGDLENFNKNIGEVYEEIRESRLERAITFLIPIGKIINKYRCYLEINEKENNQLLETYRNAIVDLFSNFEKLKPSNEKCDANLCLFFLNVGYTQSYETNKKFSKNVFNFLLKLMQLSKVNFQLLISCFSLIVLKKVVLTPDKDELIDEVKNITDDSNDIEIVENFLKKIYYINDK